MHPALGIRSSSVATFLAALAVSVPFWEYFLPLSLDRSKLHLLNNSIQPHWETIVYQLHRLIFFHSLNQLKLRSVDDASSTKWLLWTNEHTAIDSNHQTEITKTRPNWPLINYEHTYHISAVVFTFCLWLVSFLHWASQRQEVHCLLKQWIAYQIDWKLDVFPSISQHFLCGRLDETTLLIKIFRYFWVAKEKREHGIS